MDNLLNLMQPGGGTSAGMPNLESMLGPEFAGKDLAKQADQLWRFLDNLAEDDPQAYADFLKSQAKAAEAEQSQQLVRGSAAQIVIEAQLAQPAQGAAALHIWAARDAQLVPMATVNNGVKEVDAATSCWSGVSIPMFEGKASQTPSPPHSHSQPADPSHQYHIGVHPKLMPMLALNHPAQLRPILAEAAMQFIESRYALKLHRSKPYTFKIHTSQLRAAAEAAASEASGSPATSTPHDLIQAMTNMQHTSNDGAACAAAAPLLQTGKQSNRELAKQLIEEVHMHPQVGTTQGRGNTVLGFQRGPNKDGLECLTLEVELPDVCSVQDVDVEFLETACSPGNRQALQLSVQGWSESVQLPCIVDESLCRARFDKRKSVLKITVPMVKGSAS